MYRRYYTTRRQLGDRVRLSSRKSSVKHKQAIGAAITGHIAEIDLDHMVGSYLRPFKIVFDDGADGWFSTDEIIKRRLT